MAALVVGSAPFSVLTGSRRQMEAVARLSGRRASPSLSFTSDINKDMKEAATSSITPMRQCTSDKDLVLLFPFIVKPAHFVANINESLETLTVRIPVQTVESWLHCFQWWFRRPSGGCLAELPV